MALRGDTVDWHDRAHVHLDPLLLCHLAVSRPATSVVEAAAETLVALDGRGGEDLLVVDDAWWAENRADCW